MTADGDLLRSFLGSPSALLAGAVAALFVLAAALAPALAPQDPFDVASLDLNEAFAPPAWREGGLPRYLLGTDGQGRDVLSTILHGGRISLVVGVAAVLLSAVLGVGIGTAAGYAGGWLDAAAMRLADVQLSIPAILVALTIHGTARILLPEHMRDAMAVYMLILAIGLSDWPRFARVARGVVMVEKTKDYVAAARVVGIRPAPIMIRHVLPNAMGPVLVVATLGLALAVIAEATLSFLGIGIPPTTPSLGTLIRVGNDFLFSGEWWIALFPSLALVALVLSVNMLGDWLRDALDPRLR